MRDQLTRCGLGFSDKQIVKWLPVSKQLQSENNAIMIG